MPKYREMSKVVYSLLLLLFTVGVSAQTIPTKIACIGNSVTFGYGLAHPGIESYPAQLQQLMGSAYLVKNFGHSGATLLQKGHNPYTKTPEFGASIAFRPDIAIIHLGLNDTDPRDWPDHRLDFEADYSALISAFRKANPEVRIYICRLTPIFSGHPRFKSGTRDWYWQIQALLPNIAKANNTRLIDLHQPLYNRPDLFADNLHPDKEGAAIIDRTVYQAITGNYGGLKPAAVFTDHMVIQRNKPITVYGTAHVGDEVTVNFKQHKVLAVADDQGKWRAVLPAFMQGGPFEMKIADKDTIIVIKDLLIGDVWLCSGQSNMAFPLKKSVGGGNEIETAGNNKLLRLYQFKLLQETDTVAWDTTVLNRVNRLQYFSGNWQTCDKVSTADFSAVAYYFGKKISDEEHVPIGLIQVAVGGSPIESWIDRFTMEHDPVLVDVLNNWRKSDFIMKFCRDRADTNLRNATSMLQRHPYQPCYNYEAGIKQLTGFPIKGVIWYQGESNAHNAGLYSHELPMLVNSWRQKWGYQFPFYYVQLSAIDRPSWPVFRLTESDLQKQIPNSGMAVSMDMGDSVNVHYTRKKEVGERLARLALRHVYKKNIVAEAPVAVSANRSGNKICVAFAPGSKLTSTGKTLTGFELVNNTGQRFTANATIKNNTVLLTEPRHQTITKVFYAMQPFTRANLVGAGGLPISTFIIDLK